MLGPVGECRAVSGVEVRALLHHHYRRLDRIDGAGPCLQQPPASLQRLRQVLAQLEPFCG
jgi:hypothetical protein